MGHWEAIRAQRRPSLEDGIDDGPRHVRAPAIAGHRMLRRSDSRTLARRSNLQRSLESAKASFDSRLERGEGARQVAPMPHLHAPHCPALPRLAPAAVPRLELARLPSSTLRRPTLSPPTTPPTPRASRARTDQETHFNDLHKDLAGIVWELSKLRAEIARVQSQSAQGCASAGARSSEPSADRPLGAGAGGARVYSGGR